MYLRINAFVLFALFVLLSCNKSEDDADTLVQYLEYTINDSLVRLNENDTITFHPEFITAVKGNNPIDFIYYYDICVSVQHYNGYHYVNKHNNFTFVVKLPYNQMDWNHKTGGQSDPILDQGVFESLFQTGEVDYLPQDCYDSIADIPNIGIMFPFYYDFDRSFISYSGCLSESEQNMYKQDSSFFRINKISDYRHKKFGVCKILEGEFEVILYYAPGAPWEERLTIRNGRFKFIVANKNL
jgi:hypothetical protein